MKELPIPARDVAGPVHPIVANYIWWLIKRQRGDADAEKFGNQLLTYLSGAKAEEQGK